MRKYVHYIIILAAAAIALAGCAKNEWVSGTAIRFGAKTQAVPLTKSSYGDVNDTRTKQMINWTAGDTLRIACAQASTAEGSGTSADYYTSDITASGTVSNAKLELAGSKGLRWGSASAGHVFYGVYPSPCIKEGDGLTAEGSLSGQIPADQTDVITGSYTSGWTGAPDMKHQYMVAKKTVAAGKQEIDEVFLQFTPITTAIEFEVTNSMDEDLTVTSIEIISAARNLSGKFTSSLTGLDENGGTIPAASATSGTTTSSVKVSFRTSDGTAAKPVMAKGCKLTFTAFFLPETDLDDLTFRINRLDGSWMQTKLAWSATEYITFARGKKHFVKGLLAQEGTNWTVSFNQDGNPSLISWDQGNEENLNLEEEPIVLPEGALIGGFSVSPTKKVHFSKGNLVAAIDASGNATGWRFHDNQYDCLGEGGANIKIGTAAGDMDLFNWSAPLTNYGIGNSFADYSGGFVDWGLAYCTSNGVTPTTLWRTLSISEWQYLLNYGSYANATRAGLYASGVTVVDKVNCAVIYPDDYDKSEVVSDGDTTSYDTVEEWLAAQEEGAVCLVPSGYGRPTAVNNLGRTGYYFSSSSTVSAAMTTTLDSEEVTPNNNFTYGNRGSVRLVTDAN